MAYKITQELLDAGYTYHKSDMYKSLYGTEHLYQKRIRSADGHTMYFVNAWAYPDSPIKSGNVQFEVQFSDKECDAKMNVTLFTESPEEAENTFLDMWDKLSMGYYRYDGESV